MASLIALGEPTWNVVATAHAQAQRIAALPKVHYLQDADSAPGVVGKGRLLRGGQVAGFFQPVEVSGLRSWKLHWPSLVSSSTRSLRR